MKAKTIIIVAASLIAIGGIIGYVHQTGSCPMKDSKPCQLFK